MSPDHGDRHLTLLERLDLAIASRVANRTSDVDLARPEDWQTADLASDSTRDSLWISRLLELRGFQLGQPDVFRILHATPDARSQTSQEAKLVRGMNEVLTTVREEAALGKVPEGWRAVDLFRRLTAEIARFRGNAVRRDLPWDAVISVSYPEPDRIPELLERFTAEHHFGDTEGHFAQAHPVRRAARVFWLFARIAPFPDFNAVMAFVLMNAYLMANGYPAVLPRAEDKALLPQLIAGSAPRRVVQFENRLIELVRD